MPSIKLLSSDEEIIEVDIAVAKYSTAIKIMIENGETHVDKGEVIPIPNVRSDTLKKFIEWASHHNSVEDPPEFLHLYQLPQTEGTVEEAAETLEAWDLEFMKNMDQETLFDLTNAAASLDIKGLFDICCLMIARDIVDKTPDDIRLTFNILNDLTESDEEQIREENSFL